MAKILLVEDDLELAERLREWFTLENHIVESVITGEDALQMLEGYAFDIVILDWGLPGMDGVAVCERYRARKGSTPILMLTGRGEIDERTTGLDSGADDYLVKPFSMKELSARIRSLLRRPATLTGTKLELNGVSLDPDSREVTVGGHTTALRGREAALLAFFMRHPGHHYNAEALINAVWPSDAEISEDSVRSTIKNLRKSLDNLGKPDFVKTAFALGYYVERQA